MMDATAGSRGLFRSPATGAQLTDSLSALSLWVHHSSSRFCSVAEHRDGVSPPLPLMCTFIRACARAHTLTITHQTPYCCSLGALLHSLSLLLCVPWTPACSVVHVHPSLFPPPRSCISISLGGQEQSTPLWC